MSAARFGRGKLVADEFEAEREEEDLIQSATRKEFFPQIQSRSDAFDSPLGTRSMYQIAQEDIFLLAATSRVVRFCVRVVFARSVFNHIGPAQIEMQSLWKVAEFPPMKSQLSHIAWTPRHWVTNKNVARRKSLVFEEMFN